MSDPRPGKAPNGDTHESEIANGDLPKPSDQLPEEAPGEQVPDDVPGAGEGAARASAREQVRRHSEYERERPREDSRVRSDEHLPAGRGSSRNASHERGVP